MTNNPEWIPHHRVRGKNNPEDAGHNLDCIWENLAWETGHPVSGADALDGGRQCLLLEPATDDFPVPSNRVASAFDAKPAMSYLRPFSQNRRK